MLKNLPAYENIDIVHNCLGYIHSRIFQKVQKEMTNTCNNN
jgi:hypothetical protein